MQQPLDSEANGTPEWFVKQTVLGTAWPHEVQNLFSVCTVCCGTMAGNIVILNWGRQ